MITKIPHPVDAIRWATEAEVRGYLEELSGLPDERLIELFIEGKKEYYAQKMLYQPKEVNRGRGAGRILVERHGKKYVRNLLNPT